VKVTATSSKDTIPSDGTGLGQKGVRLTRDGQDRAGDAPRGEGARSHAGWSARRWGEPTATLRHERDPRRSTRPQNGTPFPHPASPLKPPDHAVRCPGGAHSPPGSPRPLWDTFSSPNTDGAPRWLWEPAAPTGTHPKFGRVHGVETRRREPRGGRGRARRCSAHARVGGARATPCGGGGHWAPAGQKPQRNRRCCSDRASGRALPSCCQTWPAGRCQPRELTPAPTAASLSRGETHARRTGQSRRRTAGRRGQEPRGLERSSVGGTPRATLRHEPGPLSSSRPQNEPPKLPQFPHPSIPALGPSPGPHPGRPPKARRDRRAETGGCSRRRHERGAPGAGPTLERRIVLPYPEAPNARARRVHLHLKPHSRTLYYETADDYQVESRRTALDCREPPKAGLSEIGEQHYECWKTCEKSNLNKHQRTVTAERPYMCKKSLKTFSWKSTLQRHQQIHTGVKRYEYKECRKFVQQNSHFITHQTIHTSVKPYECKEYGKIFFQKPALKVHRSTHTGAKPYGWKESETSPGEKLHECKECGKTVLKHSGLKQHQTIHKGEKPYECKECRKTYTWQSSFKINERIQTVEKRDECTESGKSFFNQSTLKRHQSSDTGPKCHECKESVNIHQSKYTREKSYECNECGINFQKKSYLKIHQRIHTGEKPYDCKECVSKHTSVLILEREHMTVKNVGKHSTGTQTSRDTREFTQERNPMSVKNVGKLSRQSALNKHQKTQHKKKYLMNIKKCCSQELCTARTVRTLE
ncbi:Zinc finger protein 283, partial [Galemys pyrenaicus]